MATLPAPAINWTAGAPEPVTVATPVLTVLEATAHVHLHQTVLAAPAANQLIAEDLGAGYAG